MPRTQPRIASEAQCRVDPPQSPSQSSYRSTISLRSWRSVSPASRRRRDRTRRSSSSTTGPPRTRRVGRPTSARVLRLADNAGPAAARNHGARHARGEILFFVDADVVVAPGAVEHVMRVLSRDPDVAAVFGSYDASPPQPSIVSQYRNLLHHFVHQEGNPEASTFWAGCGAVRRAVFEAVGGLSTPRASGGRRSRTSSSATGSGGRAIASVSTASAGHAPEAVDAAAP